MTLTRLTSRLSHLFVVLSVTLLGLSGPLSAAPGDPVPAFDLIDLAGNRHTADDYDGQILLLFFVGHN